ncbi:hypothetical protein SAMN05421823_109232 [Catalinimonas alkaloidigena]|uniref:Uncharacterized protein n=1 Tax=Catalinimonas alkaloidigena TaxID=1075417 RepID=A0A1G9PL93_9BACT|nr:hypothetical protein [Catalinimonas alkaloidigena]SDL99622.1 hypothetical protein SAMN05421823_109232 [Catalinimonas alkaloidigena]
MENNPELDGKYLGTISADFAVIAETLKEASYQLRKRNISQYPIFPICKEELPIGALLVDRKELVLKWNFYFSFLEEFVQRKLVEEDKVQDFKEVYKDADEFCCLFVVDVEFTNFVFLPYPED